MTDKPSRLLRGSALVSFVLLLGIFWGYGYFSGVLFWSQNTGDFSQDSALLPIGWETYHAKRWSVGYPRHYEIHERDDGAVWFTPTGGDEKKTYFLVNEEQKTLSSLKIARRSEEYPQPVDVTIANHPATKYTLGTGREEYFILNRDSLLEIFTDAPNDETIAIMLATFTVKE